MSSSKRRQRRALREAQERATLDAWQARIAPYFDFLRTQYQFSVAPGDASTVWVTRAVYRSNTTAVQVDFSVEFDRVEVRLVRLVDGEVPEYPIFVTPNITLHYFLLDDVLELRAPELLSDLQSLKGLGDEQVEASLAFQARALEAYASDVLQGDFTIFGLLEERTKAYFREHPQVVTVWLPEDATPEHEAQALEETQHSAPTQPVVVRRYRRPAKRSNRSD
jgi:hypothetical protein